MPSSAIPGGYWIGPRPCDRQPQSIFHSADRRCSVVLQGRRLLEEASKLLAENRGSLGPSDIAAEVSSAGLISSPSRSGVDGFELRPIAGGLPMEASTPRFARAAAPVSNEAPAPFDVALRPVTLGLPVGPSLMTGRPSLGLGLVRLGPMGSGPDQLSGRQSAGLGPQAQARVIAAGVRKAVEVGRRVYAVSDDRCDTGCMLALWQTGRADPAPAALSARRLVTPAQGKQRKQIMRANRCCVSASALILCFRGHLFAQESTTNDVPMPDRSSLTDMLSKAAGAMKVPLPICRSHADLSAHA